MPAKNGLRDFRWLLGGVLGFLAFLATLFYLQANTDTVATQMALKSQRLDLVNAVRLALASLSEAENGAVMATSERDSEIFVRQAREAIQMLERGRVELDTLLKKHRNAKELALMNQVTKSLSEFQAIDRELMEIAVQNSNRKAYNLAFGPVTQILKEMDEALARLAAGHASPTNNDLRILQSAHEARICVLRTQVVLLPHIAEESHEKMDQFEAQLAAEDKNVREQLTILSELLKAESMTDLAVANERYEAFLELKAQVLKLSRENTDIRSVAIALNEKRRAMLACQDSMASLEQEIQREPIASRIPSGR